MHARLRCRISLFQHTHLWRVTTSDRLPFAVVHTFMSCCTEIAWEEVNRSYHIPSRPHCWLCLTLKSRF